MIPLNFISLIRSFNKWNVKRCTNKVLNELQIHNPILITSVPNACDYIGIFSEVHSLYYCVDEFSLWPGLNYSLVKKLEEKLLNNIKSTICTSEALSLTKSKSSIPTSIITHGVDYFHFKLPEKDFNNKNPKICYFGLFDQRSDTNLIRDLAKQLPSSQIHIIGDKVIDTPKLDKINNIYFRDKVSYEKLPSVIKEFDVFILPYKLNKLTENINPLKLKEYLATGRVVISTPLPEVVKLKDYLNIGTSGEEFCKNN